MLRDVRFGVRMLLKQPGFTAIAVLTLTLGIGATAAVFSLIQGVLLTPPPYQHPERLVLVPSARIDGTQPASPRLWPAAQWQDWQQHATSFDAIAAYGWSFNFLVDDQGSESMQGMVVTRDYFRVIGVQPMLGRAFAESDTGASPPPTIIIGYDLWQRKFNGDPRVLGRTLRMSRRDTPPTVVGVMPQGVRFLPSPGAAKEPSYDINAPVDFWLPGNPNPARLKQPDWDVAGRLKDGVALETAQAELTILAARGAGRARVRRRDAAGAVADRRTESRRPPHSVSAVRRGGARAVDRVRQHRGAAAGARSPAPAGVRGPHRAWC